MTETYHKEHLLDRAAMLAMRAMIALQPPADLGPDGRAAFDDLMSKTPEADGVTYEAGEIGGVAGWWCHPADAAAAASDAGAAMNHAADAAGHATDDALVTTGAAVNQTVSDVAQDAKPALAHAEQDTARALDHAGAAVGQAAQKAGADLASAGRHADHSLNQGAARLSNSDGSSN